MSGPSPRATISLAGAGVFAGLAAVLTLAKAEVPFPIIPYLKIDFAEIPIIISFFLFGPPAAITSAIIHWLFLNIHGSDAPLGPFIKFIAVLSTIGGFWAGNRLYHALRGGRVRPTLAVSLMVGNGLVWRILTMTLVNYVVLVYVGPVFFGADYLSFARFTLEKSIGWHLAGDMAVLTYTLVFTAVYNVANLLVATIPAGLIVSPVRNSFKHITSIEAWLTRSVRS